MKYNDILQDSKTSKGSNNYSKDNFTKVANLTKIIFKMKESIISLNQSNNNLSENTNKSNINNSNNNNTLFWYFCLVLFVSSLISAFIIGLMLKSYMQLIFN